MYTEINNYLFYAFSSFAIVHLWTRHCLSFSTAKVLCETELIGNY